MGFNGPAIAARHSNMNPGADPDPVDTRLTIQNSKFTGNYSATDAGYTIALSNGVSYGQIVNNEFVNITGYADIVVEVNAPLNTDVSYNSFNNINKGIQFVFNPDTDDANDSIDHNRMVNIRNFGVEAIDGTDTAQPAPGLRVTYNKMSDFLSRGHSDSTGISVVVDNTSAQASNPIVISPE